MIVYINLKMLDPVQIFILKTSDSGQGQGQQGQGGQGPSSTDMIVLASLSQEPQ